MTGNKITKSLKTIRKYVGPVYVGMIVRNDVLYVQAVKSNLLLALDGLEDDGANATERDGALYIDN